MVIEVGNRKIMIKGVGKLFYERGLPLSLSIEKASEKGIEASLYHVVDEFWNNGWSWKTIESKLKAEIEEDKRFKVNLEDLKYFYDCLEQPKRANGGYEESRAIIFNYLYGSEDVAKEYLRKLL